MTDDHMSGRRASGSLDRRVTILEVEMRNHLVSSERLHADARTLITKLDERADGQDKRQDRQELWSARIAAGITIAAFLGTLLAPVILDRLGRLGL